MRTRIASFERSKAIVEAAFLVAADVGYQWITRESVAKRARCSTGLVNRYYGTMADLKDAVVRLAITREHLGIVADAIASRSHLAGGVPQELRERALRYLMGPSI